MSSQRDSTKPIKERMCKLHNRRVICGQMKDGSYGFKFRILRPGRKIDYQSIRLSLEAVLAMASLVTALGRPDLPEMLIAVQKNERKLRQSGKRA